MKYSKPLLLVLPLVTLCLINCNHNKQADIDSTISIFSKSKVVVLDTLQGYQNNQFTGELIEPLINSFGDTIITGKGVVVHPEVFYEKDLRPEVFIPENKESGTITANRNVCDSIVWSAKKFPHQDSIIKKPVKLFLQLTKAEDEERRKQGYQIKNRVGDTVATCVATPFTIKTLKPNMGDVRRAHQPKRLEDCLENIQLFGVEQGLPDANVFDVVEDDLGNIWICSEKGVTKYNGTTLTHLDKSDGLTDDVVYRTYKDSKGRVFFGSRQNGFSILDGENLLQYDDRKGLFVDAATDFLYDSKNRLWVACYGKGVSIISDSTFMVLTQRDGLWSNKVDCVFEDSKGRIWIGAKGGLSLYQNDTLYNYHRGAGLSSNRVFDVAEDNDGRIWFATYNGISVFDGTSFIQVTKDEGLISNQSFSICNSRYGMVIGTDKGVYLYRDNRFYHYGKEDGIPDGEIPSIEEDRSGNIWICHNGVGLFRWQPESFVRLCDPEEFGMNGVANILEDSSGDLWFGTHGYGVVKFDGRAMKRVEMQNDNQRMVRSFLQDSTYVNVAFWGGGMARMVQDGAYHKSFVRNDPVSGELRGKDYCLAVFRDSQGRTYYSTDGDGVYIKNGDQYATYNYQAGMPSEHIRSIKEDKKGNIWLGSNGFGLIKLKDDVATCYSTREGLSDNTIYSLLIDKQDRVWAGTKNGGICMFDGAQFVYYNEENGMPSNTVWALAEDDKGRIFAGTNNGLVCLTPTVLIGRSESNEFVLRTYGFNDGLQGVEFYENGLYIDSRSNLWCGINGGLTIAPLKKFDLDTNKLSVRIESIDIDGEMLNYRSPSIQKDYGVGFDQVLPFSNCPMDLSVPFSKNHLTFKLGTDALKAPHKVLFSYKLSGHDDKWSVPSAEPTIDYLRLAHGDYVLMIRAAGESGVFGPATTYSFEVLPPWWYAWWAKILYLLALVMLVIYIVKRRTALLKARAVRLQKEVDKATIVIRQQKETVEAEKKKSDELLLNILPAEVAEELKAKGVAEAKQIDMVTVLFTDFKGFTALSEQLSPRELVMDLNECFSAFDMIMQKHGIEKIKTIGDAYMAAGGLPVPNSTHAGDVVSAAIEIREFMLNGKAKKIEQQLPFFEIRIGVHTGPVVAGIVGVKKFAYDIWGDTVNTASRMESSGEVGMVNISGTTYELIKDEFACTYRGKISAKGKGEIDMYFVTNRLHAQA